MLLFFCNISWSRLRRQRLNAVWLKCSVGCCVYIGCSLTSKGSPASRTAGGLTQPYLVLVAAYIRVVCATKKPSKKKASGLKHTSTSLRRQHYCAYAYAASLRSFTGVVLIVSAHKRSAARRQRATHTACNTCFPCLLETRRRAPHYRATNLRRAAGNNRSANMSLPRRH